MKALTDKGAEVVGISGDSAKSQALFKKLKKLNFTLLADEEGAIAKQFGVPFGPGGEFKTKDEDGKPITLKRGVTIRRWTFVIGKDGTILFKDPNASTTEGSKKILEVLGKAEK